MCGLSFSRDKTYENGLTIIFKRKLLIKQFQGFFKNFFMISLPNIDVSSFNTTESFK